MNKKQDEAFTLVEVLIFVVLISIIFITVSYYITFSLYNTKVNEHKILATRLAEEAREWLRGEKEISWDDFINTRMGEWCFNTEPVDGWGTPGLCTDYGIAELYKRDVSLTASQDGNQVTVKVNVEWVERTNTFNVLISTVFSIWE